MSADPTPRSVSPSTTGSALPLAGTVSRWPPSTTRRSRPSAVRAITVLPMRSTTRRSCADASRLHQRREIRLVVALRRHADERGREREEVGGVEVEHRVDRVGHVATP